MTDLLEFLNSADSAAMMKLTGINQAQADALMAGRPLASLEACSKIKGVTKKRLTLWQEELQIKVEEDKNLAEPVAQEITETDTVREDEPVVEEKPKRKNIAGRIIGWILVLLILAGAVYAFVKWGIPFLYEKYVKPVENNAAEITDLAAQQGEEVARLNEEITVLVDRVSTLEARADAVDLSLQAHDEALASLESMQELLNLQIATQKSDLLLEISNQISLTRAIELLSRSRLYLSESNFGLAKIDLQTSRDLLYTLLTVVPADQTDALSMVIERIDMALENLPAYPVVAVYDVDIAWQLLIDGLPNIPAQAVTPVILPPTEQPAATATVEPTAEPTVEPSPEPTAVP